MITYLTIVSRTSGSFSVTLTMSLVELINILLKKIISDEHEYEKLEEIVEKFNEYFSTIGQTINQQIENCTESYPINETEFSMFLTPTNIPEVKK